MCVLFGIRRTLRGPDWQVRSCVQSSKEIAHSREVQLVKKQDRRTRNDG